MVNHYGKAVDGVHILAFDRLKFRMLIGIGNVFWCSLPKYEPRESLVSAEVVTRKINDTVDVVGLELIIKFERVVRRIINEDRSLFTNIAPFDQLLDEITNLAYPVVTHSH